MSASVELLVLSASAEQLEELLLRLGTHCDGWRWQAGARQGKLPADPLTSAYAHGGLAAEALTLRLHGPEASTWRLLLHCPVPGTATAALQAGRHEDPVLAPLRRERPGVLLAGASPEAQAGLEAWAARYCRTRRWRVPVLLPDEAPDLQHPGLESLRLVEQLLRRCRNPTDNPVRPDHGRLPLIIGSLLLALLAAVVLAMLWPQPERAGVSGAVLRGLREDADFSAAPELSRQAIGLLRDQATQLSPERRQQLRAALWRHHEAWNQRLLARPDLLAGAELLQSLTGMALAVGQQTERQTRLQQHMQELRRRLAATAGTEADQPQVEAALALAAALVAAPLPDTELQELREASQEHLRRVTNGYVQQVLHRGLYVHQGARPDLTGLRAELQALQSAFQEARVAMPAELDAELAAVHAFLAPLPDPSRQRSARIEILLRRCVVTGWPTALAEPVAPVIDLQVTLAVAGTGVLPEPDRPEQSVRLHPRPLADGRQRFAARLVQDERAGYRCVFDWRPDEPLLLQVQDDNGWWGDVLLASIDSRRQSIGWSDSPWAIAGLDILLLAALQDPMPIDANGQPLEDLAIGARLHLTMDWELYIDGRQLPPMPALLRAAATPAAGGDD